MFKFEATIGVFANYQLNNLFKSLLTEQFSKRTKNDFLISFDKGELHVELYDVNFTEKFAPKIINCGNVKRFSIENQAEPETETAEESETKSEEVEAEAAEESEIKSEEPEAETAKESEIKSEEPKAEAIEDSETESEKLEAKVAEEPEVIPEEFLIERIKKMYEEAGANTKKFCEMLADYVQIPDNIRIKKAFYELIEAVIETEKMSWFCIENRIKNNAKQFYEKAYYNNNTKVLISISIKKKFNLTLLKFLKQIKDATESIVKVDTSEKNAELSETSVTVANNETANTVANEETKVETEIEVQPKEELKNEVEVGQMPEENIKNEVETKPESKESIKNETNVKLEFEEGEKQAEVEIDAKVTNSNVEKNEDVFDEYWSGIFSCMPKIISTDTYRINKALNKEKQFLAIDKTKPISFRIKEVLEIMEDISLVADPNFITFSEKIFTKVPEIKIERSMPLYEKTRLLQWSKMLQKFVQRYYTKDPNFRVKVDKFLTELREIIMTPEEIKEIK